MRMKVEGSGVSPSVKLSTKLITIGLLCVDAMVVLIVIPVVACRFTRPLVPPAHDPRGPDPAVAVQLQDGVPAVVPGPPVLVNVSMTIMTPAVAPVQPTTFPRQMS